MFQNFTLKELLQIIQLSQGRFSDIALLTRSDFLFNKLAAKRVQRLLKEASFTLPAKIKWILIA